LSYQFDAGECSVDGTLEITVNPLPAIDPGVDLAACPTDAPIPLTASPAGGTWSSPDGGVITNEEFAPVASGVGTYTLLYTYTDTENCTNSASIMATVHPLPQVVANDTTYCNTPGLVDLPFASPVGGTWSGPGLSGGQFDPNATGTGTFDLTYVFTNANNCTDSTQIQVTVSDPDQVSTGPDTSFCASITNVDLTAFGNPAGGTWSLQGGGPGLNGNTFDPSAAGDGTYTLLYSIGSGNCEVTASFQITVFGLASVDLSANPTELCVSEPAITLQALPTGGTWTGTGISGDQFDPMVAQDGTFPLLYNYTDANGCDASNTLDLTVHPLPQLSVGDTTYCNTPGTVNLPFTAPAGGIWEGPGVAGDQFDPNGAGGVNDYTLQYTFTDGNGCTDSIDISVMVIEPVAVEAGPGDTVCIDQGLIQLTGFNPAGGTWSGPGIVDPTAGTFDPQLAGGGPITLSYSLGGGNCEVVDQTTVEVIDVTSVDPGPGAELCLLDDPITLTGASPSGGVWSGLGITDPIAGTFDPQLTGDTTVTITYTYTEQFSGCAASATTTVTVHPMPESDFTLPAEACIDQDILFTNTSADTFESAWTFGDGGSSTATDPTYQYTLPGTYTVTLISTTQEGCTDSASLDLFITEPPVAAFTTDTDEGCSVLEVNTSNSSSGYDISYFWDLGNGDTTSLVDPGTIFYEQGINDTTYILTLAVSNLCATVEAVDTITVYPLPQVNFGTNVDTGCTPLSIQFANLTMGNPENFFWDLGNGITSTDSIPPSQIYYTDTVPTTYPVTLIATNFCGTDTLTQEVTVNPVDVEAFFNVPTTTGCQPLTLPFTSFATPGAFVEWDFGDGNTAANPNPVHTFTEAGTFEVVQYVTNGCGYDSATVNITVLPAPDLSFEHAPFVCLGDTIQFSNTSLDPLAGTVWDFGDGDSSVLNNPLHTYEQEGTYTVQLTGISSQNGCPATVSSDVLVVGLPTADFSAPSFDGCTPFTITFANNSSGGDFYTWDFGDGNTSTDEMPTHTYLQENTYTVSLIVTDDFGCSSDTAVLNVTSHPVPVAGFSYDADQTCGVPVTINFENLSQGAQGYEWSFGQGATSTLVNPAQVYVDTGQFVVQLIASNQFGCQDTSEQTLRTLPAPTADFDWDPLLGCNPQRVQLFNNSQLANGFTWFFTDGGSAGDTATAYVFQEAGNYGITLIADYDGLCFDTLEIPNAVEILPSPFANFDWSEITDPELSGSFNFTDASEFALSWQWDFGDGTISEETNPFHRFFSNGPQQVLLTVTGANGCTDDTLQIIIPGFFKGLHLPNALSPEYGPEETRVFQPKGAGLQSYHLQIFSSYGELIWETRLLEDGQPVEAWDGTFRGNLLPPDVYVWKASATFLDGSVWEGVSDGNGGYKKVGSVLLIR
jgi:PKD repeat protein